MMGYICTCARVDVPPFPYLGSGWTDCSEIWCVVGSPLARLFAKVSGGAQLQARAHVRHVRNPFSYLGNGRKDCAEIWYVVRDPLAKRFTRVDVRTAARVHVDIPFPCLGNGWTDCTEIWCVASGPVAMRFTEDVRFCTKASVTVTHLGTSIPPRSFIA